MTDPSDHRIKDDVIPAALSCPNDTRPRMSVLQKRSQFLQAARAKRHAVKSMVVQARQRGQGEDSKSEIRVGYTCSKKVGNAVARNRAKRRLRAAVAAIFPDMAQSGWDYVLIGRRDATSHVSFEHLKLDLEICLKHLHRKKT